jgi:hypothetical protein
VYHLMACQEARPITDSASGHDRDAMMSSHLPHGPLRFFLLAQLDVVLTHVHYYSLLGPHVGAFDAFEEMVMQVVGVVTGGYVDHWVMWH